MSHEHHHHEHGLHRQIAIVIIAALLLTIAVVIEHTCSLTTWQLLLVYLVPYLTAGFGTLKEAAEGLTHGEALDEHFLMSVATIGALCIGFLPDAEPQMLEAVFVMLFFLVGEIFEICAEGQSRRSIAHLMDLRPDVTHVEKDGRTDDVAPQLVGVGDTVVVRPGERVPIDGIVIEGTSALDTVALTGESMPRSVTVGDEVVSGCVNKSGLLRIRTTKSFGDSTASKIIELVENAADRKSHNEAFITRFARVYTPVVVAAALLIAIVPPIVCGTSFAIWLYRSLMFLIVSCPCALVLSVPLTFFGGIGAASRHGILIKGSCYIDLLAKANTVVFDKTGTLTEGQFAVSAVHHSDSCQATHTSDESRHLLHLAAHVEHHSTHPIGAALRDAFPEEATDGCIVTDVEEIAGKGVRARVGDRLVCVGNSSLMEAENVNWQSCSHAGTIVHIAIDGTYAGHVVINDRIKDESLKAITALKQLGVNRLVMLTGDRGEVAAEVATELGIDEWHASLLPADKVEQVERLSEEGGTLCFVGDGINDAPVLARADVGIAMGALGSEAAIDAADVVLMDDRPQKIATAIALARRTLAIARQNVCFAIGVKIVVLLLAGIGLATMSLAVFADVGVTVLVVLNAMRAHNPIKND